MLRTNDGPELEFAQAGKLSTLNMHENCMEE